MEKLKYAFLGPLDVSLLMRHHLCTSRAHNGEAGGRLASVIGAQPLEMNPCAPPSGSSAMIHEERLVRVLHVSGSLYSGSSQGVKFCI